MERSDIRGSLARTLPRSIRAQAAAKETTTALISFGIPKLVRFDKIRTQQLL
jgi:hypothetical protein